MQFMTLLFSGTMTIFMFTYEYLFGIEPMTVSWWDLCYLETRVPEAVATVRALLRPILDS